MTGEPKTGLPVSGMPMSETRRIAKLLNCGLFSGLVQAAVFNPWDRALYLSVKNRRAFLNRKNFINPFAGVMQTIAQRTMSAGLYFPLEDIFSGMLVTRVSQSEYSKFTDVNHRMAHFVAGLLAGSTNGLILNPFASVKFYYWGKSDCGNESFMQSAREMYRKGGIRPFLKGSSATIQRDFIFGGIFALVRHEQMLLIRRSGIASVNYTPSKSREFVVNAIAASLATILSAPMNYVRVIHYATPPDIKHASSLKILTRLVKSTTKRPTLSRRLSYLQSRLRIGWGTARVGFGMAFSATLYDLCSRNYHNIDG